MTMPLSRRPFASQGVKARAATPKRRAVNTSGSALAASASLTMTQLDAHRRTRTLSKTRPLPRGVQL